MRARAPGRAAEPHLTVRRWAGHTLALTTVTLISFTPVVTRGAATAATPAATVAQRSLRPPAASRSSRRPPAPRPTRTATAVRRLLPRTTASSRRPVPAGGVATVIGYARAQVGKPYRYAAAGPDAWDCSGLVMAAYARAGVRLPHRAADMLGYGRAVPRDQLRAGDLLFPSSSHVSIYLGGGLVIEAANPQDGVRITKIWGFWTARRLL